MQDSVKIDRDKYIGGSDIAVIMNLSPFKSRYDLLLEKAGYKEDTFEGNVFTEYGNTLEPIIRNWINTNNPSPFIEGKHIREAEQNEIIGVRIHTDGENDDAILEIKTTSQIYDSVYDYKIYLVQLLYYMVLTDKPYGLLAVYERPEDLSTEFDSGRLHLYKIVKDEETGLINEIEHALELFIEDLAKVKANPFITEQDLLPAEIPDITDRILAFESQLAYYEKIQKQIKDDKARLKKAMEAASVKTWTTPNGYKITLVEGGIDSVKQVFDEATFKDEQPDLYAKYQKDKLVKGKSGYILITPPKDKEG
jgi:predicted phage-related endonuclease